MLDPPKTKMKIYITKQKKKGFSLIPEYSFHTFSREVKMTIRVSDRDLWFDHGFFYHHWMGRMGEKMIIKLMTDLLLYSSKMLTEFLHDVQ